jgi:hypothetical protein
MDARGFDVYGWSGDVLVRCGIRGGRLCRWSQCRCSQSRRAAAGRHAGWLDRLRPAQCRSRRYAFGTLSGSSPQHASQVSSAPAGMPGLWPCLIPRRVHRNTAPLPNSQTGPAEDLIIERPHEAGGRVADVPGIWAGPARRQRARRRSARAASACACAGQIASGQHSAASSKSLIKWALAAADAVYVSAGR